MLVISTNRQLPSPQRGVRRSPAIIGSRCSGILLGILLGMLFGRIPLGSA
jgi:hypothetical protein